METDFVQLMTTKSEEDLQVYIDKRLKYNPKAVYAAIEEFKNRGRIFSEEELSEITLSIAQHQETEVTPANETRSYGHNWDKNVIDDAEAIELYSQKAIMGFTIGFGVFFGSILMAINLKKTEEKTGSIEVLMFGVLYTVIQVWILSLLPRNSGLTLISSLGGGLILNYYFWKKHIGENTPYRRKQIWIPLIIGIAIATCLIFIVVKSQEFIQQ